MEPNLRETLPEGPFKDAVFRVVPKKSKPEVKVVPYLNWCFSCDSESEHDEDLLACTYAYACPNCGALPIDIFVDRITRAELWQCFFSEGEAWGIIQVIDVLNRTVVHELSHWAGCEEEAAFLAGEISHDETCAELDPSKVLRIAARDEGVELDGVGWSK